VCYVSVSLHRPNRLGLSVVELAGVEIRETGAVLLLRGVDLLDGTPVRSIPPSPYPLETNLISSYTTVSARWSSAVRPSSLSSSEFSSTVLPHPSHSVCCTL
jgi:tRNA (Thr-GGU) A37 N-methylase